VQDLVDLGAGSDDKTATISTPSILAAGGGFLQTTQV
jgi:hypothetical protein